MDTFNKALGRIGAVGTMSYGITGIGELVRNEKTNKNKKSLVLSDG